MSVFSTAVWAALWSYYVCTEGSEGMSSTNVEMSGVESLEEADVIKTLRLEEEEKDGNFNSVNEYQHTGENKDG